MKRIAIIGAGLSGLVAARQFDQRHEAVVFEKSRGVGGRIATRSADDWEFDHGAQFFTARSRRFRQFLKPAIRAGRVALWNATFAEFNGSDRTALRPWESHSPHYVGAPRMNALPQFLADGIDIRLKTTVAGLTGSGGRWRLHDASGLDLGEYDWVVSTAPAAQTAALLPPDSPLAVVARERRQSGCYALMLGFDVPLALEWHAALVKNAPISWISVNSSKPGRGSSFAIVVHSRNAWADEHMESDPRAVQEALLDAASQVLGLDASSARHIDLHRWRYANIDRQPVVRQVDPERRLAACGDWFVRGRIEGAFTSAEALVAELNQLI